MKLEPDLNYNGIPINSGSLFCRKLVDDKQISYLFLHGSFKLVYHLSTSQIR